MAQRRLHAPVTSTWISRGSAGSTSGIRKPLGGADAELDPEPADCPIDGAAEQMDDDLMDLLNGRRSRRLDAQRVVGEVGERIRRRAGERPRRQAGLLRGS